MNGTERAVRIAAEARQGLADLYGPRLKAVLLFGSMARGEGGEASDIDIAVVLDRIESSFQEHERVRDLGAALSLEAGELISFLFVSDAEYQAGKLAVHRAIRRDGIPI